MRQRAHALDAEREQREHRAGDEQQQREDRAEDEAKQPRADERRERREAGDEAEDAEESRRCAISMVDGPGGDERPRARLYVLRPQPRGSKTSAVARPDRVPASTITAGTERMPSCCQWRSRSRTSAP